MRKENFQKGPLHAKCMRRPGLRVSGLRFNGILNFYLGELKELDQTSSYSLKKSTGRLRESDEGELRWFSVNAVPYHEMWQDDQCGFR